MKKSCWPKSLSDEKKVMEEEECEETEAEDDPEAIDNKPVCWFGAGCWRKSKHHFRKYAHPFGPSLIQEIKTTTSTISAKILKKRKRDINGNNKEDKVEITTNSDTPPASLQPPLVLQADAIQQQEQQQPQPAEKKRKLTRQFSSQTLLDAFLAKIKDKDAKEAVEEATATEQQQPKAKSTPTTDQLNDDGEEEQKKQQNDQAQGEPPEAPNAQLPSNYIDAWDSLHIKLPCSPQNTYRRVGTRSRRELSRWYLIHTVLAVPIHTSTEFQEAVIAYNCTRDSQYAQYWDFTGLHHFFLQLASTEEHDMFFDHTLPFIIKLALRLPELFPKPTPLLVAQKESKLILTQEQIACLLANGFLCTFPTQGPTKKVGNESSSNNKNNKYPSFSFHTLFMGCGDRCLPNQAAKLRCLFHYFHKISNNMPQGNVSFERVLLQETPLWGSIDMPLNELVVSESGLIEDDEESLQVDFANRMVGGGVLGYGCIQEEIRFLINTELIASLLFTARLGDDECLLVTGAERYCKYDGYAQTFRFAGNYDDNTPRDDQGRRKTQIVAIDALYFGLTSRGRISQYRLGNIQRELNKCFAAFSVPSVQPSIPVATGNWGCGAFGGYHDIKSIIQLMAAAVTGRQLHYYTFGEPGLAASMNEVYAILKAKNVTVAGIWQVLEEESHKLFPPSAKSTVPHTDADAQPPQLFNILLDRFESL